MVSRRAHIKYQRWSFNQSLIWFYCRGSDEIVMGKDNYINYIVLMGLTFGNQTWLGNPHQWRLSVGNSMGKLGDSPVRHVEKRGQTPAVIIKLVYVCL